MFLRRDIVDAASGADDPVPFAAEQSWAYTVLGSPIGATNIVVAQNGARTEILLDTGSYVRTWIALATGASHSDYEQVFVSAYMESPIRQIAVGDIVGDQANEVIVLLENSRILIYDLATKRVLSTFVAPLSYSEGLAIADVDGDGANEMVVCGYPSVLVLAADGTTEWTVAGITAMDLTIAQMDTDLALEIALTGGPVIDTATHEVQWTAPTASGLFVRSADIDNDGISELLVGQDTAVRAFDVDEQHEKWNIQFSLSSISALYVANVDSDPTPEILVGHSQSNAVTAYDPVTLAVDGSIEGSQGGVSSIGVGDPDGQGRIDVIWSNGGFDSGPDHFFVADWDTKAIEWTSLDLTGPMVGPDLGDLDGDGRQELVVVTRDSDSNYGSGRILVFDARSHRLRGVSDELFGGDSYEGIHALRLRDVDADGRQEILVAGSHFYDGGIAVFKFNADDTFTVVWALSPEPTLETFCSIDAADVDGDGAIEIIAGTEPSCSCAGTELYVYGYASGHQEWRSGQLGNGAISGLALADVDLDGVLEIVAMRRWNETDIIDGASKAVEMTLLEPFTALRIRPSDAGPVMVFGTESGQLVTYARSSVPGPRYAETSRRTVVPGQVDGVTYDAQGRTWIGSAGRLYLIDSSGATLWTSPQYPLANAYDDIGTNTVFLPGSRTLFTAGATSVVEFSSGTGFGTSGPGVYASAQGAWFLKNTASPGPGDVVFTYGPGGTGVVPLVGDWNGDGTETAGIYDVASGFFFLKNSNTPGAADLVYGFGPPGVGWIPIAGDWNGDGTDTVGLYNPVTSVFFLRNSHAPGPADTVYSFGPPGSEWSPVTGDFDGDGVDTVGLFDPVASFFFLKNSHVPGAADGLVGFGAAGSGWTPLIGDWDGDGIDTIGLRDPATGAFFLRNSNTPGAADVVFGYGPASARPLTGDWDGL